MKKMFVERSQNSQENTQENTRESPAEVFSCEFCGISKNTFFTEQLWTTACAFSRISANRCF